jgi:hypothetical protein
MLPASNLQLWEGKQADILLQLPLFLFVSTLLFFHYSGGYEMSLGTGMNSIQITLNKVWLLGILKGLCSCL